MSVRGILAVTLEDDYIPPEDIDVDPLNSIELAGNALNDPSDGRQVQNWTAWWDEAAAVIKAAPEGGLQITLFAVTGVVTQVSLAFDSNMQYVVAYIEDGVQKLRWFNTLTPAYQTDTFASAAQGRVTTDDKRSGIEGLSDVVFAYVKDNTLYYREQRDRFLTEYTVGPTHGRTFTRFGMNNRWRLQFELI